MRIDTVEELRTLYPAPKERAIKKQLSLLDEHCQKFIQLSPFAVLASCNAEKTMDASPRGGAPGFIKVPDHRTLLIPDSPGNNRLDTLENIIGSGMIGLIFFIPGIDETLRVNGTAHLSCAEEKIQIFSNEKRLPKLVIEVMVTEAYLHCAKALMRSALWESASQVDRSLLPTMGKIITEQTRIEVPCETQEEMVARYKREL